MSQTKPDAPVIRNAQRHPHRTTIQVTTKGGTMAPILAPALKIPVASARSFFGNHSATVLMLAGKTPDSPRPNADRATRKLVKELPRACPIEARLQKTIAKA